MSSGISSSIPHGSQVSFEQNGLESAESRNEQSIVESIAGFFAGEDGKVLPAELSGWIGDNQRDHYLSLVSNSRLKNAVNQLYRKSSIIGDGGTAAVIRFEKATGRNLGRNGKNHIQKGRDMLSYLNRIASSEKLSQSDRIIANKLISDLKTALGGK